MYDQLLLLTPTPVVAVNRAVALAEVDGPTAALDVVDRLDLDGYYLFHATRAHLLRRLGRRDQAAQAYTAALALTGNPAERTFLSLSGGACTDKAAARPRRPVSGLRGTHRAGSTMVHAVPDLSAFRARAGPALLPCLWRG